MSSSSGFLVDAFEGVNDRFTSIEDKGTHGHNRLWRAKRYGRWLMLKGLGEAELGQMAYHEMLVKEFDIMSRLQHPGVVQAVNMEDVDGLGMCIVMEWVDGVTLKEWLQGDTTRDERRQVASQLMDALAHIHQQGVVHRDIKPSNIMITNTGMAVKVIDFGLADTDQHAVLKQPAGTVSYMAPEQAAASVPDVRNDIYSLGMVLGQMDLGGIYKVPIARCLLPIEERYQSVDELIIDLRRRAVRRRNSKIAAAILAVLALIAAAVNLSNRLNHSTTNERVDSLHNQLERTTTVIDQSIRMQDSLVKRLAALNDSLVMLNSVNAEMRGEQHARAARQQIVDQTIAEGIRRIDAINASTHLKHHLDTLSNSKYLWMDWNYLSQRGRSKAMPEYMIEIHNRFSTKELAEIEYALTEHCTQYETRMQQVIAKKNGWIYRENQKLPQ